MTPRTIAYVSRSPFVSGAERSLVRLAVALDPARYRPFVVASEPNDLPRALRVAGLDHCIIAMPLPERLWPIPFVYAVARMATRFRTHGAALVHVNDTPGYPLAGLAARLIGLPRVCHVRCEPEADGLRWHLKHGFERVVFISHHLKRYAQERCAELLADDRCVVIHDGFDPPVAPETATLAKLGETLGLLTGDPVVGFFGQVIEVKGVREYLLMAERVLTRFPRCRFLVVGEDRQSGPDYRREMEALARQLGIAAACRFIGFRDDVSNLLHLCDVVAMPSHIEPFGLVALETAAAGRPLVAARVGGLLEIVEDGETGVLVPPRDAPALAAAVGSLLADPIRRAQVGASARTRARMHFSATAHARAMADLYDEVLAEASAKRGHALRSALA